MMRCLFPVAALVCAALPASAEVQVQAMTYVCERQVNVPVVYVNSAEGPGIAVIQVEGGMYNLQVEQSASGTRYAFPSDGSHYVWWTKGDVAMLLWHDGTNGQDEPVYSECTRKG